MTQEEILQYNKMCAKFLGGLYDSDMTRYWFYLPVEWIGIFAPTTEELKFHSDWNWIMEMVEAIEKLGYKFQLGWNVTALISLVPNTSAKIALIESENRKEAVVQAINQFLIWYYERNKNN